MNLTLKFLGDTPLEKLPKLIEALGDLKIKMGDIELNIDQSKIFNPKRPQVLNLSIKDNPNHYCNYLHVVSCLRIVKNWERSL